MPNVSYEVGIKMTDEKNPVNELLFDFEKLEVYKRAEDFSDEVTDMIVKINERIYASIKDQLIRSSSSVFVNIAEGCSNFYRNDKKRYYRIARGSVFESILLLRYMKRRGLVANNKFNEWYHECHEISKMISGLIRSVDDRWVDKKQKKSN
jgi:four helix bundle protein